MDHRDGSLPVFEAVFNFRDLGGTPTRDGRRLRERTLFRSGEPDRMRVDELGHLLCLSPVATAIDLRGPDEPPSYLGPLPDRVTRHHLPMWDDELEQDEQAHKHADDPAAFLTRNYGQLITRFADLFGRAFEILADPAAWPVLIHCSGGKDRTGLLTAFVLEIAGVSDDEIVRDYLDSEPGASAAFRWLQANGVIPPEVRRPTIGVVQEAALRQSLDTVRSRYGSTREFLEAHGAPRSAFDIIRSQLVT